MVKTGLQILKENAFKEIKGRRVGIIANQTAVDSEMNFIVDLFLNDRVNIKAIFAPEHGFLGEVQDALKINDSRYGSKRIPIYSIYGKNYEPSKSALDGIDVIVFDIQDIGCRYYTFISTLFYALKSAGENKKEIIVLDRPNPINGVTVEGNVLDEKFSSFVGIKPIATRHGMTAGEIADYFNSEYGLKADLKIIRMKYHDRKMWFDETGLQWVLPSPNMPFLSTAVLYPGLCLIEGTNVSEGRGTTRPFEIFGAPWIDNEKLKNYIDSLKIDGVRFRKATFKPVFSKYSGQICNGIQAHVTDRKVFKPVCCGVKIIEGLHKLFPKKFEFLNPKNKGDRYFFDLLAGTDKLRTTIQKGGRVGKLFAEWGRELEDFQKIKNRYFLYRQS